MFNTLVSKVHGLMFKEAQCPNCGDIEVAREATFCPYCITDLL